ncbi:hypothetical protein PIB30_093366 [Stylosanthes scabra]|uniref:Uncharacterized protein n=1 Tax=Stylosanthes scabra TaxID=79078 RepID=A0ABU6XVV3_9FABA|nr:hypothetical protein [Stylosanthes scabra]
MPGMRCDSYNPKSDRADNAILTPEARGWQRMITYNVQPIKHHTTFSMNRLPFPFLITRLVAAFEVVPSPKVEYLIIPGKDRDCPFGDWRGEKKKARKGDIAQPPPPPPPPIHEPQAPPPAVAATSSSTTPASDPF